MPEEASEAQYEQQHYAQEPAFAEQPVFEPHKKTYAAPAPPRRQPRSFLWAGLALLTLPILLFWLFRPTNLYPVEVAGKYGFIKQNGSVAIAPQFDGASTFSEGLAPVL